VKILMTNQSLSARAGSESYLETVSAELRRLGHEVVLFSPRCGAVADGLRGAGFEVLDEVDDLPADVDVVHGQHSEAVALVRTRLRTPLVFVAHSWFVSIEDPLPELGAAALVALNDLSHRRLAAHVASAGAELVRLTQPVTVSYADAGRRPPSSTGVRAVAVSRTMRQLPARLADACAGLGFSFDWVGGPDRESADAREEVRSADVVFAVGRSALEAMAAARATFVVDEASLGGWVGPASYTSLEADGFTGQLAGRGDQELEQLLADYRPELGADARRLAVRHHSAPHHAAALVELYARVADRPVASTAPPSLGLLAHERFALETRAVEAEWRMAGLRREVAELGDQLASTRAELAEAVEQRDRFRRQRDRLRRRLAAPAAEPRRWLTRWRRR